MSSACRRRSITACISAIRRCACTRWASAASTRKPPRTICASWRMPSTRSDPGRRARLLDLARDDAYPPGRRPRRQPHRRLGGDRPAGRRDGRTRFRHLPDRPRHLRRRGAARLSRPAAQGGARQRPPDHVRHAGDQAGRSTPNPWDYQLRWIDETVAQGGRIWGQATTRSINAIFSLQLVSAVRLPAGLARAARAAARRAEGAAARSRSARPPRRRGSRA